MYTQVHVWVCCSLEQLLCVLYCFAFFFFLKKKTLENQKKKKKKVLKLGILEKLHFLKELKHGPQLQSLRGVPALAWITHELQFLKAVPVPEYIGRLQDGQYSCLNLGTGRWGVGVDCRRNQESRENGVRFEMLLRTVWSCNEVNFL